ncbi:MAG: hypothetical protein SFV15_19315 [Polyangiaceae bacterium]|nr:hypothetical protein [Polyangiaceae bacterium]
MEDSKPFEAVPEDGAALFRMAWQLENWFRLIVYVELRAAYVDWEAPIRSVVAQWPPRALGNDKRLHHMATAHASPLSYLTFAELWKIIADDQHWQLFEPYFPPKEITTARIEEVRAIRNRIAHFRAPHVHDVARFTLFLNDMASGLRRFCQRYNAPAHSQKPDAFHEHLGANWRRYGYGTEMNGPNGWLYAPHDQRTCPTFHASLSVHRHPLSGARTAGLMYCLALFPPVDRYLDVSGFLEGSRKLHDKAIHVRIESKERVSVVLPAVQSVPVIGDLAAGFLQVARDNVSLSERSFQVNPSDWSESVLWPSHVLNISIDEPHDPLLEVPSLRAG